MASLTIEELIIKAVPTCDRGLVRRLAPYLEKYLDQYNINKNDNRLAFFLGHCAVESAYFRTLRELGGLSYFEKMYGKKKGIPPTDAKKRKDLKYWYIGRGLIQTTWDYNYKKVSDATGINFVASPWLLEDTENAVKSATIFWDNNRLNDYADAEDYRGSTKKINGGYNHLTERTEYIKRFKKILSGDGIEGLPIPKVFSKMEMEVIQKKLQDAGYHEVGIPNGDYGSRTVAALAAFQSDNGLPVNGQVDSDTMSVLENPPERIISEDRATGTPEDDEGVNSAKRTMQIGAGGAGLIGVPQVLDYAKPLLDKSEETRDMIDRAYSIFSPVKTIVTAHPEIFIVLACIAVFYFGFRTYKKIVSDFRKGSKM